MRCFLGLALPETYQEKLAEIIAEWRPKLVSTISWTKKGNWHLTLAFLGDLRPEIQTRIREGLASVRTPPFELQAQGAGFFPPKKTPRVVWIGVGPGRAPCQELAGNIEQTLAPFGFPPSKRGFNPHLTLARIKKPDQDDWQSLLLDLNQRHWPRFRVESFVFWQSRLTPQGPVYTPITEFQLPQGR